MVATQAVHWEGAGVFGRVHDMEAIERIKAIVVTERGRPTVRVTLTTERAFAGVAELPAGISVGTSEAKLLNPARAVRIIATTVGPALTGVDVLEQRQLDQRLMELDGTEDRSRLGVNSLLPISLAACRAAAAALNRPLYQHVAELTHNAPKLPTPIQVMIEGGAHAPAGATHVTFQECSFIGSVSEGERILAKLEELAANRKLTPRLGGEGGLIIPLRSNRAALTLLVQAAERSGVAKPRFAIDAAVSHAAIGAGELTRLLTNFPLAIVEDPVAENDLPGWQAFTAAHGHDQLVAADDLTVGNPLLIKDAVKSATANALVVKLNQTATLSELFDLVALVRIAGWQIIVSHRGHESPDTFIVDLAVGLGANYLKAGTTRRPERKVKYDRLAAIAAELRLAK